MERKTVGVVEGGVTPLHPGVEGQDPPVVTPKLWPMFPLSVRRRAEQRVGQLDASLALEE